MTQGQFERGTNPWDLAAQAWNSSASTNSTHLPERTSRPKVPLWRGRFADNPAFTSTSPRHQDRSGASSRSGSASSSARPSAEAPSPPSPTSPPRSAHSSTDGTSAPTHSPGPRPPTKSSPKPTVKRLQTRATSLLGEAGRGLGDPWGLQRAREVMARLDRVGVVFAAAIRWPRCRCRRPGRGRQAATPQVRYRVRSSL